MILRAVFPIAVLLAGACLVSAADRKEKKDRDMPRKDEEPLNNISLSYRAAFNVGVKFKNFGAFNPSNPGPLTGNTDHNYDDGYVREDNNNHPFNDTMTWNYNYRSSEQVIGDQLAFHSSSSAGVTTKDRDETGQGFELAYTRKIGRVGRAKWGFLGAFNYTYIDVNDSRPLTATISQLTDLYNLNGVVPNDPGPAPTGESGPGTPTGPGPLISDSPASRTINPNAGTATVTGTRSFQADLYGFHVGPYIDFPLCKHTWISLSGGLALAEVNSEFRYTETITYSTTSGPLFRTGDGSHSDLLAGGFVAANLNAKLSEKVNAFVGVQFQSIGTYRHTENGRIAEMDLSKSIFFVAGLGFSF
jgi:hypothetical protein